jgi:cytochrome c oxidase subunit 2
MNRNFLLILLCFLMAALGCQNRRDPNAEHVKVVMKKYTIEPAIIRVKAGKTTELEVSSADVQHGFDVPELGIKVPVRPGNPAIVTLKLPAKGEYKVVCGIMCGPHHEDMQAKVVVE